MLDVEAKLRMMVSDEFSRTKIFKWGRVVTPGNSFNYLDELLKIYLSEFSRSWIYQYYYKYYWTNKSVGAVKLRIELIVG